MSTMHEARAEQQHDRDMVAAIRRHIVDSLSLIVDNDEQWHTDMLNIAVEAASDHYDSDGVAMYEEHEIADVIGLGARDWLLDMLAETGMRDTNPWRLLLSQLLNYGDRAQWQMFGAGYVEHVAHTAKVAAEDAAACSGCGRTIGDMKCPNDKTSCTDCCECHA